MKLCVAVTAGHLRQLPVGMPSVSMHVFCSKAPRTWFYFLSKFQRYLETLAVWVHGCFISPMPLCRPFQGRPHVFNHRVGVFSRDRRVHGCG